MKLSPTAKLVITSLIIVGELWGAFFLWQTGADLIGACSYNVAYPSCVRLPFLLGPLALVTTFIFVFVTAIIGAEWLGKGEPEA